MLGALIGDIYASLYRQEDAVKYFSLALDSLDAIQHRSEFIRNSCRKITAAIRATPSIQSSSSD